MSCPHCNEVYGEEITRLRMVENERESAVTALAARVAELDARHKRVRSVLDSLKKHCELTSSTTVTHSTTYQLVIAALAALTTTIEPQEPGQPAPADIGPYPEGGKG